MTRSQVLNRIEIGKTDFVIDIGGGHRPFWRADLVIEKFPFDHSLHRNQPMHFPRVPVIKADALAIPIPNGGCDLVFASHIIEHLPDPARFVAEIRRCSRRAYLEFPSRNRELMFAWSFHAWLIETTGTVMRFYRNDLPQLFGPIFHEEYDAALGAWSDARHELLNTSVYCRSDELECEFPAQTAAELVLSSSPKGDTKVNFAQLIHRPRYSLRENLAFLAQSVLPRAIYSVLSRLRRSASSSAPLPESLLARLMCLQCRTTNLRRSGAHVVCRCGAEYAQARGVFDFDITPQA
jgi:SAM-dependent methyltransferase